MAEIAWKRGQAVGTNVIILSGFLVPFEQAFGSESAPCCRTFSEEAMPVNPKQTKKPRKSCSPKSMKFFHAAFSRNPDKQHPENAAPSQLWLDSLLRTQEDAM
jgi:hypothetical protein